MSKKIINLIILSVFILSSCAPVSQQASQDAQTPGVGDGAEFLADAPKPPGYEGKTWTDVLQEARGQKVNFYMWGGSDLTNSWVTGYVASTLNQQYGITLNMVPVTDIIDTVNKVLGEKQAGKNTDGSVDLIWINGENFRAMRQAGLLFGPWSGAIPNSTFINWGDPSIAYDFGYPVDGYESPYGKAQFVMVYDSARVTEPPQTVPELLAWAKANPGRFTYAAPPDFTGSVFVRHACYSAAGGYQEFIGEFDAALFEEKFGACWKALQEIEPYLWRSGETYPESRTRMQDLFANGEIDFDMTYNPAEASSLIAQGKYPESARTFVFNDGTIANTNYLAITFNSANKAGAMVAANFMLSPEAQFSKAEPTTWGDLTPLDLSLLPAEWQAKFAGLGRGVATLPDEVLAAHRLPELRAGWLTAIEEAWEKKVLYDQ